MINYILNIIARKSVWKGKEQKMSEENKDIKVAPTRPGAPNRPSSPQRPGSAPVAPNRPGTPVAPTRPGQPINAKSVEEKKPISPVAPQRPTIAPQTTAQPVSQPEPQKEENIANKIVRLGTTPSINLCSKKGTDNIDPKYKDILQQAYNELEKGEFGAASGDFETILKQVRYPVAVIGDILAISGAKSIDSFHSDHAHNFTNYDLVKEFLDTSVRMDDAITILNVFCEGAKLLVNYKQTAQFVQCYLAFCDYNDNSAKKLHRVAYDYAIACIKAKQDIEDAEKLLEASVLRMCNNRPYSYYMAFIQYIIGAYVTTQNFERAGYWKDKLLEQDERDLYANWAGLKVEYKTSHDNELFEALEQSNACDKVAKIIDIIRQDDYEKIVTTIHKRLVSLLAPNSTAKDACLYWINLLNKRKYEFRDKCIEEDLAYLMNTNYPTEMESVFNSILEKSNRSDVNKYTENMFLFATNALSKDNGMSVADKWFMNINRVDRTNYRGYLGRIYCKLGAKGIDRLYKFMPDFTMYQDVDNMLKASDPKVTRTEILSTLLSACIMYVVNSVSENEVYEILPGDGVFETFEHLLERIPQEEFGDEKPVNLYIKKMAQACFERELFDISAKYYREYSETDDNNSEVYWGIIQSKLECETDEELVYKDELIKDIPEYEKALQYATYEEAARYKDIATRQEKRIAETKKAKGKKKSKKAAIISVIAIVVVIAVVAGVFGGLYMVRNGQEGLEYNLDASGQGYIVSAQKYFKDTIVTIPSTHEGKPITEIGSFAGKDIKEFYMPSSVTVIQDGAFNGCKSLKTVMYLEDKEDGTPESLDSALNAVSVVTSNVKTIGNNAFNGCSSLTTIFDFSISLIAIGDNAFNGCSSLKSVVIPASVNSMGINAFANCSSELQIILPNRTDRPSWPDGWNGNSSEEYECLVNYQYEVRDASGSVIKSDRLIYGKEYTLLTPRTNARVGYTFDGWFSSEVGGTRYSNPDGSGVGTWSVMGSRKVYAHWAANSNDLVFYPNGGTGTMDSEKRFTGETKPLPANTFTRAGYEFIGWATSSTGSVVYANQAEFTMPTDSAVILYAVWESNTNELVFNANGGTGTMASMFIDAAKTAILNQCTFTRNGYKFIGWSTTPTGAVEYANGASYTMGEADMYTLYAQWDYDTYTITYVLNEGTNSDSNPTSYMMTTDTIQLANATRFGYDFSGWYTTENFSTGTEISSIATGSYGNKTLYAKWTPHQYTITYILNDGTKTDPDSAYPKIYTIEDDITLGSLSRVGYRFVGWFLGSTPITRIYNRTGDMLNLTAQFELQEYSVTYILHGGTNSESNPTSYYMTSEPITLVAPTKEGYTFLGWIGTSISSGPRTDVTIVKGSRGDRTYEACWSVQVRCHANNNTDDVDILNVYTGETVTLVANTFEYPSYTFVGWSLTPNGDIAYHDCASLTMGDDHLDLYAKWVGAFNFVPIYEEGTTNVIGYKVAGLARTLSSIVIPEEFGGKPIVGIAANAFKNNTSITNVVISSTANFTIERFAFYGCTKLTSITIPSNVISIGQGVFAYCNKLTSITFPGNTKYELSGNCIVDKDYNNGGDKAVIAAMNSSRIPTDVKVIAPYAFYRLTIKSTLVFDNQYGTSVERIEENAFFGCIAIQTIEITKNIQYIGQNAFANMVSLKNLSFTNDGTENLIIDSYAFYNCYAIKSLTVPARLTDLRPYAFAGCSSITNLSAEAGGTYVSTAIISGENKDHQAIMKKNLDDDYYTVVLGCASTLLYNDINRIGEGAFYAMTDNSAIKLTIRSTLKEIGEYAFYGCTFQSGNVNIQYVTTIGDYAFAGTNVTLVRIQESVETMGENVFYSCLSLNAINCYSESKPDGWDSAWYGDCEPSIITFGYKD